MKRFQLLIAFLFYIPFFVTAQANLQGKWYMFSRNRMIELTISSDKIVSKQLNWDLSDRARNEPDTQSIRGFKEANGNVYLYLNNPKRNANQILLNTIKVVRPRTEILLALNSTERLFDDTIAIVQYIKNDTSKKDGMPLFSDVEIQRVKAQKNVDKMTEADFKAYVEKSIAFRTQLDSLSKLSDSPTGSMYYGYAMMRIILGQLGYNPLVTSDEFNKFILRFKDNPETKAAFSKLFEDSK